MKSVILSLTFSLAVIACFAQPRWYTSYTSMQSTGDIRSAVIGLENAQSVFIAGSNVGLIDINGDYIWQKKILGIGSMYDGLQLADGTIVLVGYFQVSDEDENYHALMVHGMSSEGETLWASGYSIEEKNMAGLCVSVESDSTLVVGGYVSDETDGSGNLNGLLVRLNLEGELVSGVTLPQSMAVQDIQPTADGHGIGVGCFGQFDAGILTDGEYSYFGYNSNLGPEWWYTLEGDGYAMGVVPLGDNYAVSGAIAGNVMMVELSADGFMVDSSVYDSEDDLDVHAVNVSSEGNVLLGLDQLHNTGSSVMYTQPVYMSMSSISTLDLGVMLIDGEDDDRFVSGIGGMVDGSYLISCRDGGDLDVYKIFPDQPLPGCALGQIVVDVVDNSSIPVLIEFDPEALANNFLPELAPSIINFSSASINNCGGNYCELELTVSSTDPNQCLGSVFEFLSTAENAVAYEWLFDGESVGEADTLALQVDEWGFFEVQLNIIDENFCSASDVLSITVLPSPEPILTVADSVALCEGQTVQIATTETYDFYTWNTLSNQPSITIGQEGEFYVTVIGENGCQATSEAAQVVVGEYPEPTVELAGVTPFCANDSVTISTQEYADYEWTFGQDVQSFQTAMPGPYFVMATSDLGCVGFSDTLWIDTLAVPTPFVVVDGPLTWCMSEALTVGLGANENYDNVIWSNNVSDSSITVSNSGLYSYQATSFEDCSAYSDTVEILVWVNPIVSTENVLETDGDQCNGLIEIAVLAETAGYEIEWTDFPDETGLIISDLCYGNYIVTITDENGCSTVESFFVDTNIGITMFEQTERIGYPNPVKDIFTLFNANEFEVYRLINGQGALVESRLLRANEIDLSSLSSGVYHLQMFDGESWFQLSLIKL